MSPIRLTRGVFFADILRVHDVFNDELWVYIVQRTGSPDVLGMGSCTTREAAEKLANKVMAERAGESDSDAALAS